VRPPPSDERALASVLAVERALDWYVDEVTRAADPPVTEPDAVALRDALAGGRRWQADQFETLVTFSLAIHRMARINDGVPDCNLGDALTALATIATAEDETRQWQFDPRLDAGTFAKLDFGATSEGIARAQRNNYSAWRAHAQKNRAFIEAAIRSVERHRLAVVLGAGHAFDLPLVALSKTFERLVLVDIDELSLESTVASVFKDPGLRTRVETRVMDLTGINAALVRVLDEMLSAARTADEIQARLDRLCRSYRLTSPSPHLVECLGGGERPDVVISSCVLSQLAWPQRVYAQRLYEERFGGLQGAAERRFIVPWREFELRVQQDHINGLSAGVDVLVLTSDMVSHPTVFDPAGHERPTGHLIVPMAVESLRERVPSFLKIVRHEAWPWNRYRPSRRGVEGSLMDVEGAVLREVALPAH
jgi:hypothetical protein